MEVPWEAIIQLISHIIDTAEKWAENERNVADFSACH